MAVTRADIETYKSLMQQGARAGALAHLEGLLENHENDRALLSVTAPLAAQMGASDLAVRCYTALLEFDAISASDLFNIGYALKALGQYAQALQAYDLALQRGIEKPEDVHLNMGVILADELHDNKKAEQSFRRAIALNPSSLSPYINLGNLFEETGGFNKAEKIYRDAVIAVPDGFEALARLANAHDFEEKIDPLLAELTQALLAPQATDFDKECLHFALGTAFNSLRDYEQAWHHYDSANQCGLGYGQPYVQAQMEDYCNAVITAYTPDMFKRDTLAPSEPTALPQPVFICGMFRSGSTLTEQILSAHPNFTPLGECDFIPKLAGIRPDYYPIQSASLPQSTLVELSNKYRTQVNVAALTTPYFTDKRPDNWMYLGLIKQIFPNAKIIHTKRRPEDIYLSIYFTQFSDSQSYARRWQDIAHYHEQQQRLMSHWKSLFGDDIVEISYDEVVENPEQEARRLLSALSASWDPACLTFHTQRNRVKTASYKQVRKPLYKSSSGRWKNYQQWIPEPK